MRAFKPPTNLRYRLFNRKHHSDIELQTRELTKIALMTKDQRKEEGGRSLGMIQDRMEDVSESHKELFGERRIIKGLCCRVVWLQGNILPHKRRLHKNPVSLLSYVKDIKIKSVLTAVHYAQECFFHPYMKPL